MSLNTISPIDGRYAVKTKELTNYFSEKALMQYRIFVEIKYLIHLTQTSELGLRKLKADELKLLNDLSILSDDDALIIKQIETKGYQDIPATNHDVKAIEYYIKLKLSNTSVKDLLEMVHFALTSEDINNIAYSFMLKDGFNHILFPQLIEIFDQLYHLAIFHKNTAMLARTHGQPASPTVFGKELIVFLSRLKEEIKYLANNRILLKLNGATGNYNAHYAVYPHVDWQEFSETLIGGLNQPSEMPSYRYCSRIPLRFEHNRISTQIEPHDSYSRIFDGIKRINTILIDLCQDIWRYISDGWIKQKAVKGEIGSSAMPHKVNPIDFENAEGNFGVANSLLSFFSSKLSISRLQRDLSDSTVLRNIGSACAYSLIAYQSLLKGLSKIAVNQEAMLSALEECPEVIAEAYQNILRTAGVEKPYELLKEISRGKKTSLNDFYELARNLEIDEKIKARLLKLKPENYTGIASEIVAEFDPNIY